MSKEFKNKWFLMGQKKGDEAEVYLYDKIGEGEGSAKEFIQGLNALGDVKVIHLRISSGGGSVVDGNNILGALRRHPAKVITYNDAMAASMASVLLIDGDERHMAENALLMIHNPKTVAAGGADDLRRQADALDMIEVNARNVYAKSNKTDEEIDALMQAETYFTAKEALEAGFIDFIDGANLAAASITDFETVKENGYTLPQATLDALTIETKSKQIGILEAKISDFDALIEGVKVLAAKDQEAAIEEVSEQANKSFEAYKEIADSELAKAKEVTQAEISAKAAELMAETGVPPIDLEAESNPVDPDASASMTEGQFWNDYNDLKNKRLFEEAQEFYRENSHVLK
jgi:ATP-dependent protease ClpP protease subunit